MSTFYDQQAQDEMWDAIEERSMTERKELFMDFHPVHKIEFDEESEYTPDWI